MESVLLLAGLAAALVWGLVVIDLLIGRRVTGLSSIGPPPVISHARLALGLGLATLALLAAAAVVRQPFGVLMYWMQGVPLSRDVYTIDSDGGSRRRLTQGEGEKIEPVWSPDGRKIAFVKYAKLIGVCVIDPGGSHETRLTESEKGVSAPVWSPDSRMIAFGMGKCLWMRAAEGSEPVRRINFADRFLEGRVADAGLAWAPDGSRIVFTGAEDGPPDLYIISANGEGLFNLTKSECSESSPVWSPDGSKIVFTSRIIEWSGPSDIFVINTDGSGLANLTDSPEDESAPVWSPKGTRIACIRNDHSQPKVYVMNVDGSDKRTVAETGFSEPVVRWCPQADRIAFDTGWWGRQAIFTVNADGSQKTQLTDDGERAQQPAWSPDGTQLAYSAVSSLERARSVAAKVLSLTTFLCFTVLGPLALRFGLSGLGRRESAAAAWVGIIIGLSSSVLFVWALATAIGLWVAFSHI